MTAVELNIRPRKDGFLDGIQNALLDDLTAARMAAMQILVFHTERCADNGQSLPSEEFLQAVKDIYAAQESLIGLENTNVTPTVIILSDAILDLVKSVGLNVAELARVLDPCCISDTGDIKGFQPTRSMYDLCCTRVAKSLGHLTVQLARVFAERAQDEKREALDKTSSIAMEIGKIGRIINMVATNASIEAACAGDAGKGFSVIADEVKTLSSRVSSLSVSLTEKQH